MDTLITLATTAVVVGLGFLHSWLSRLPSPWFGAVVPALFLALVVLAAIRGVLDRPRDYAMVVLIMFLLIGTWSGGRAWRTQRTTA